MEMLGVIHGVAWGFTLLNSWLPRNTPENVLV